MHCPGRSFSRTSSRATIGFAWLPPMPSDVVCGRCDVVGRLTPLHPRPPYGMVSVDPETCVLRFAESFYKRGRLTLLFDKFKVAFNESRVSCEKTHSGCSSVRAPICLGGSR